MALNLRAPHLLVRAAASLLTEARGCVVNLVDLSALQPWTTHPAHAVSKAGLAHLTRVQARALAPRVRVNAIAPGAVLPPDDTAPELLDELRGRTPLQTLGTPDDVVGALLYLRHGPGAGGGRGEDAGHVPASKQERMRGAPGRRSGEPCRRTCYASCGPVSLIPASCNSGGSIRHDSLRPNHRVRFRATTR